MDFGNNYDIYGGNLPLYYIHTFTYIRFLFVYT